MPELKIKLPRLHPLQQKIASEAKRFNVVAGGEKSGKTTLGIEVLLASKRGALSASKPVAWFAPDQDGVDCVRRLVKAAINPAIKKQVNSNRLELVSGAIIDFYAFDALPKSIPQYEMIVVDDACRMPGLWNIWQDTISETLREAEGDAWFLSGAFGKKNDFYSLFSWCDDDPESWACWTMPSISNPHFPASLQEEMNGVDEQEYRQRFLGEFLDKEVRQARRDLLAKINLPELHDAQKKLISEARRYNVAVCGRRFGKTFLSAELLIDGPKKKGALHGYPVALYAPTYPIMLESWYTLTKLLAPVTAKKSEQNKRLDLVTGGSIELWSLDNPDAGRGRKYSVVVIDEAAMIRKLEEAFTQNIQPLLLDYQGEAWVVSTPKGDNYFKRMFDMGNPLNPTRHPDWQSWQLPTWENPYISREDVEDMRSSMPRLAFLQEIEAQFVTFAGTFIKAENIHTGVAPAGMRLYQGVDLAISMKENADYTAIVTVGVDPEGRVWIVDAERRRVGFRDAIEFIKAKAERWGPDEIAVEAVQYQVAVVEELLRSTTLPVRQVRPDKDKLTRAQSLITRYENNLVWHNEIVPQDFMHELLAFGPDCEHDDYVDAAVYAYMLTGDYKRTKFFIPDAGPRLPQPIAPTDVGIPDNLKAMMEEARAAAFSHEVCGRCANRNKETGICSENGALTGEADPGCFLYLSAS